MRIHAWFPEQQKERGTNWFWFTILFFLWLALTYWAIAYPAAATGPTTVERSVVCEQLALLRGGYPSLMTEKPIAELLNSAIYTANTKLGGPVFAMLGKSSGNRCGIGMGFKNTKGQTTTVSCDFILHPASGLGWDALIDAGGSDAGAAKTEVAYKFSGGKWIGGCPTSSLEDLNAALKSGSRSIVLPVQPGTGTPVPPLPDPCPVCPTCPTCPPDQQDEVKKLSAELLRLHGEMQTRDKRINELEQRIASVGCRARNVLGIRGFNAGCDVTWGPQVLSMR